jgi:hypothetical protein
LLANYFLLTSKAIFRFHHLNEFVGHFPVRREAFRIGRLAIPLHVLDLLIFACTSSCFCLHIADYLVRFIGLLAQFIAAVILINENTSPRVYIPLGVAAFIFGVMEGGIGLLRDFR